MKWLRTSGIAAIIALWVVGCAEPNLEGHANQMRDYDATKLTDVEIGAARLAFDEFNGLNSHTLESTAIPWKIAMTALLLDRKLPLNQASIDAVMAEFGFGKYSRIANWPASLPQPRTNQPLGIVRGDMGASMVPIKFDAATLGCASCHAGMTYDAHGQPSGQAWLGLPNSSLDLDSYVDAIAGAMDRQSGNRDVVFDAIPKIFPETSKREMLTLRHIVWPKLQDRLKEMQASGVIGLPFRNGGPGRTNGIDSLKRVFALELTHGGDTASVNIPSTFDLMLRSSLLADGFYATKGGERFKPMQRDAIESADNSAKIVSFFTVATMNVEPQNVPKSMPGVAQSIAFLNSKRSPVFPGPIDTKLAEQGAKVYQAQCESCHGKYSEADGRPQLVSFPNWFSPLAAINTDAYRSNAITPELIAKIRASRFNDYIDAKHTGGYIAQSLTGIWATAPYMHNGSIPTLWHVLTPSERPKRFMVGGHSLDMKLVGVAGAADINGDRVYSQGYRPWSKPMLYDTTTPGRSNAGHDYEPTHSEKLALIEYLKRL